MAKPQPNDGTAQSRGHTRARRRRWIEPAFVVLGCFALVIWVLFFANRPARQVGQLTLTPPGGAPVQLTLWAADPLVELPFTTDTAWVRCGKKWWKLHGRSFGSGVGPVAVSPDLTQAVVHRGFEGGYFPAVMIDLRTGEMLRLLV